MEEKRETIPTDEELTDATLKVLQELGGSGTNEEILDKIISFFNLSNKVADLEHKGSLNRTELDYRVAWAKTRLKNAGYLENSSRGVWSIKQNFEKEFEKNNNIIQSEKDNCQNITIPEEVQSWRERLTEILKNMNPYAFERLAQRVLRESGFVDVQVTKKSGDGGIDGIGKLKINGIFTFNVAFQCKRYKDMVGSPEITTFRGSLPTNIEKGVLITTGIFSKAAKEEACAAGKKHIDLIDGEEFIDKIAECHIGVKEIKSYEIDEQFFENI
ncbi:MAG: restriction endonuclease [Acidaminococcaceae bacterium]|nr:restriction endonuclease [Acidaminococcaceae bacterium]